MKPYFDLNSLFLYVFVGIIGAYLINLSVNYRQGARYPKKLGYVCFFLIFVALAGFRLVTSKGIGGIDSYNYQNEFLNPYSSNSFFAHKDVLFRYFNVIIRFFTDSPVIYRIICYFFISYSYIYFIKGFSHKGISCIPFVLIMVPYLKSMNTMRTSMAIGLILIGLVFLKDKKIYKSLLFFGASLFVHRMSVLYILFLPFYAAFKNFRYNKSNSKLIIFTSLLTIIAYVAAIFVQQKILELGLLEEGDVYYAKMNANKTLLSIAVSLVVLVFISVMWLICNKRLRNDREVSFLKLMIIFDIIVTPVSFILGMWRANEYFYVGRLTFWSYLIPAYISKYSVNSQQFLKIVFSILFIAWLAYRIMREWEPCGLMPYKLIF